MEFVKGKVNLESDILLIDKPVGWSSHDVVAKIRGEITHSTSLRVKVGHGGTLDPFATGVLLILIGKATRRFDEIRGWEKEYEMEIKLGEKTDTGDSTGKVIKTSKIGKITPAEAAAALRGFVPGYEQTVPAYSAVQVGGRRLYKIAREGETVNLPSRQVKIKSIKLVSLQGSSLKVRVVCGSGTYMRQLAVDIGAKLNLPAHAAHLRRLRVGKFKLRKA
ncbi:MAG TPA: tRNA pseudouridine(55) synthase TruB [Patescibacteria group bacterium]|nr:tRNA pseudouridine(55) synthase TruB [Patescibacteria group bacterium]